MPKAKQQDVRQAIAGAVTEGRWVSAETIAGLDDTKGAYILVLELSRSIDIELPRSAATALIPGWYAYAGSARGTGGLRARLQRHFRADKKPHWHIDRLTAHALDLTALMVAGGDECVLTDALLAARRFDIPISGFGSTDCRSCSSHLLRLCC